MNEQQGVCGGRPTDHLHAYVHTFSPPNLPVFNPRLYKLYKIAHLISLDQLFSLSPPRKV